MPKIKFQGERSEALVKKSVKICVICGSLFFSSQSAYYDLLLSSTVLLEIEKSSDFRLRTKLKHNNAYLGR